ncbi:MAG: DUF1844 domain-containing protein [Planctomycetes bacterium]|nr:DUF1844 domain-containing protein [Planctomycetota bacterium]
MTDDQLTAADLPLPGGSFRLFITRLSYQGLMSLGIIENPLTNTKAMNLPNAKMLIEDLEMIRDKTRGNLDEDEDEHLAKLISDLQSAYRQVLQKQPAE